MDDKKRGERGGGGGEALFAKSSFSRIPKGERGTKKSLLLPSSPPLPVRQNKFMVAEEEEVGSLAHFFCLVSSPQRWFDLEERGRDPRRSGNQRTSPSSELRIAISFYTCTCGKTSFIDRAKIKLALHS